MRADSRRAPWIRLPEVRRRVTPKTSAGDTAVTVDNDFH